jgi:hypothetical protein
VTRMRVSELWRYPVKSLHGEPLAFALLGADARIVGMPPIVSGSTVIRSNAAR